MGDLSRKNTAPRRERGVSGRRVGSLAEAERKGG